MKKIALTVGLLALISCSNVEPPKSCGPVPTERQMKWHHMEKYAFFHFNMNTFSGDEWGYGDKSPDLFNPTKLDCDQWVKACKEAGLKGVILTCKHHDGFCLWPTKTTDYSVKSSKWKGGEGDVVKELSEACHKYNLKFGVYLSPWDRNNANYGTSEYIKIFREQLTELLTNYGEIFEVWFDGANGGDGYYGGAKETRSVDRRSYYDWPTTIAMVRKLQPDAMIFSDAGPDTRWVGNESGYAGKTNWSPLKRDEFWPGCPYGDKLTEGQIDGDYWLPAEVDVSIRPGWYYHDSEDHQVRSLDNLMDLYYHSVGRNASLNLNIPPTPEGLLCEKDIKMIKQMGDQLENDFRTDLALNKEVKESTYRGRGYSGRLTVDGDSKTYWATSDNEKTGTLTIDLGQMTDVNRFLVQEYILLGQRVKKFSIEAHTSKGWEDIAHETTIGYKRILRFPTIQADKIRLNIEDSKACPLISNIEIYNAPKLLIEPKIERNRTGEVTLSSADLDVQIYYTLDGTKPNVKSEKYTMPFSLKEETTLIASVYDGQNWGPVKIEKLDMCKENWTIVGNRSTKAIDDNSSTVFYKPFKRGADIIVDLGSEYTLKGFNYTPDQGRWGTGIIDKYRFYISFDGKNWGEPVSEGEFSNIKSNPIKQRKEFNPKKGRYIKLHASSVINNADKVSFAEIGVTTM